MIVKFCGTKLHFWSFILIEIKFTIGEIIVNIIMQNKILTRWGEYFNVPMNIT